MGQFRIGASQKGRPAKNVDRRFQCQRMQRTSARTDVCAHWSCNPRFVELRALPACGSGYGSGSMVMHYGRNVRGPVSPGSGTAGLNSPRTVTACYFFQVFVAQLAFVFAAHNVIRFLVCFSFFFSSTDVRQLTLSTACASARKRDPIADRRRSNALRRSPPCRRIRFPDDLHCSRLQRR